MSLASLLTHTVSVKRQAAGAGVQVSYQAVTGMSAVKCLIQPLDPEDTSRVADSWGSDFKAFFASGTDIRKGDRLTDQDGQEYGVRGIRLRNYGPARNQHVEALLGSDRSDT